MGSARSSRATCTRLNAQSRKDPGTGRPDYGEPPQPIRNGDGGNLALSLLGLPAIPDSLIDKGEDLTAGKPLGR